jgi:glycosyltransferase involved in cell wall biosynthesis
MNIGFDAKRFFHNNTGLGNYSRTLVKGLVQSYPQHQYYLFNPKSSNTFQKPPDSNVHQVLPQRFLAKKFPAFWRSSWVTKDLERLNIQLYHGLSHEIPIGIQATSVKSVVTMHDLIFERYPEQYKKLDIEIYRRKYYYACAYANRVIAISQQTKNDLVELYKTDPLKIDICYQSCNPAYARVASDVHKEHLRRTLSLPGQFFLYVGSVIERKNLLSVCEALHQLRGEVDIPLVVIGSGKGYLQKVKDFIQANGLSARVIFLSENGAFTAIQYPGTMAAIYQMATALIYPSVFEGFGIPVLEALSSGLPVITSNVSCLPETGGDAALYVNPLSGDEIREAMKRIYFDEDLRMDMIDKGIVQAQKFDLKKCSEAVMAVYNKVLE